MAGGPAWDSVYAADGLPPPVFDTVFPGATNCSGIIEASAGLLHGDTVSSGGTCLWVDYWNATVATGYTIELRSKDVRGGGYAGLGFAFWGSADVSESAVEMSPSQLILGPGEHTVTMDTTGFHTYRLTVLGGTVKLYIDGALQINTVTEPATAPGRHFVGFGDGSGVSDSEYYLDYFAFSTSGAFSPSELASPSPSTGIGATSLPWQTWLPWLGLAVAVGTGSAVGIRLTRRRSKDELVVFVCHSMDPESREILAKIRPHIPTTVRLWVAEDLPRPGSRLSDKVMGAIRNADVVLALLTRQAMASPWVNQELAIAVAHNKLIIPLKEKRVRVKGVLEGIECIEFDPSNPNHAFLQVARALGAIDVHEVRKTREKAGGASRSR